MKREKKYSNKVDIYALECILLELLIFRNYSDDKDFQEIKKVDLNCYSIPNPQSPILLYQQIIN